MASEAVPIVIDVGTKLTKVGTAGGAEPSHVFPTKVAIPKNFHRTSEAVCDPMRFGHEAEKLTTVKLTGSADVDPGGSTGATGNQAEYRLKFPVEYGLIAHWELFEDFMEHILYNVMNYKPDIPLLLTESVLSPKITREKYTQLMFERFEAESVFFANTASLTAFSSGTLDGIVVECGNNVTYVAPVYDGCTMPYCIPKCIYGGSNIKEVLMKEMRKKMSGSDWSSDTYRAYHSIARDIISRYSYFSLDYKKELQRAAEGHTTNISYTLPDGSRLDLSKELFQCTEVIFDPSDLELPGLHEMVCYTKNKVTSPEVQEAISGQLICGGAFSTLPGFTERLEQEVNSLILSDDQSRSKNPVKVRDLSNRKYSAWIGGAILATTSHFRDASITNEEYDEYGPTLVHKKCFL